MKRGREDCRTDHHLNLYAEMSLGFCCTLTYSWFGSTLAPNWYGTNYSGIAMNHLLTPPFMYVQEPLPGAAAEMFLCTGGMGVCSWYGYHALSCSDWQLRGGCFFPYSQCSLKGFGVPPTFFKSYNISGDEISLISYHYKCWGNFHSLP